ncbi:MAG: Rieske (2Fe-2S) protein [Gemmatimonas sp.]
MTSISSSKPTAPSDNDGVQPACAGCVVNERREFVQNAVRGVVALLGLSAIGATPSFAQHIMAISTTTIMSETGAPVRIEARYPVPAADGVSIDSRNDVIIARVGDSAYAFSLACPHQNTALRWLKKDNRFQCPKHQSKYRPTGEFIEGRATRNMDRLPIKLDGTTLVVDTSQEIRSDTEAAKWAAAVAKIPA